MPKKPSEYQYIIVQNEHGYFEPHFRTLIVDNEPFFYRDYQFSDYNNFEYAEKMLQKRGYTVYPRPIKINDPEVPGA